MAVEEIATSEKEVRVKKAKTDVNNVGHHTTVYIVLQNNISTIMDLKSL